MRADGPTSAPIGAPIDTSVHGSLRSYESSVMLNDLSRAQVIALWFLALAVLVTVSLVAGVVATPGTWALLLLISLVPPAISFVIWRGARHPPWPKCCTPHARTVSDEADLYRRRSRVARICAL